ncbi:MAG: GGDEF domain-containing protein [Treponema sp.]|nr:GGDEF domain-containing protein [Treponema sp.]
MRKFLYSWRFYSFGREQYQECMGNIFSNNLLNLRHGNSIIAIFACCFAFFPIVFEKDILKAGIFLGVALIALLISFYSNFLMQQINIKRRVIFLLLSLYYANLMLFGTYISVWVNQERPATVFFILLICALQLFINPPQFNLSLALSAMAIFIVSTILCKDPEIWIYDVTIVALAGSLSIYFNWHITKLRMGMEISTTKLEEELNKYVDQSITDELTQLRNRRDFMQTFQRFLSNYRASDDWLCVALADIDFFKFYNDHYGHPKGDDCLRSIGEVLNSLNSLGVYAARVGGEEFALLWFEKDPSHVDKIVHHWTNAIRDLKIPHEKSKVSGYVTMSIGVYIVRCGSPHDTQELYDLADKALYTAKGSGRNCTIVCGDEIKQYKITPKDE